MADAEVSVGTILGGTYQITALLGRGGMGAVWSASHLRLPGKRVAVKVLHQASANDESYARFRREAEIATRIGHPNIVDVLDWNTLPDGKTPYLVLEYLNGESLSSRLMRGPIPVDQTLTIVRQIGSALHAAHRAGVIHRDLKPDNIFLCPTDSGGHVTDHVKVLDFGISKIRDSQTMHTQEARLLGTPQYMAPEQATGKNAEVDERSDLFALGAIVYEMLAGRPAFVGDNLAAIVFQVVYEDPPPLETLVPAVPPAVVAAVRRALAKERGDRQPDVLAFVAELTGRPMSTLDRKKQGAPNVSQEAYAATADAASFRPPTVMAAGTPFPQGGATAAVAAPRPGSRGWLWVVIALLVAGGAAAGAVVAMQGSGPVDAGTATAAAAAPDATAAPAPDAAPATATAPAADAAPVAVAVAAAPDAGAPKPRVRPRDEDEEPEDEPAPVIAELVEAEKALARRDYQTAIRLARRSLTERRTVVAYSVIARGYCGLRDLGNANAALQKVSGRERIRVYRRCRAMGFPLD
jgi:serine/threonine-protein kinase